MVTVGQAHATTGGMRWGRVVIGGFLLEGVLLLITVPVLAFVSINAFRITGATVGAAFARRPSS